MKYKKVKNALYYEVAFYRESGASLLFVLDTDGSLEDIDPVYFYTGRMVN